MIPKHIQDMLEMKYTAQDPIPYRVTANITKKCEDCGIIATNRVVNITLANRGGRNFWRRKCSACDLTSIDGENWQDSTTIERIMRSLK